MMSIQKWWKLVDILVPEPLKFFNIAWHMSPVSGLRLYFAPWKWVYVAFVFTLLISWLHPLSYLFFTRNGLFHLRNLAYLNYWLYFLLYHMILSVSFYFSGCMIWKTSSALFIFIYQLKKCSPLFLPWNIRKLGHMIFTL